ncbi:MAG: sugar transferase [Proteobacteria bacterium]|nr:sugar transferase [Pseudomonadota bacterium]MBU1711051.1 sugar transferase [Pseudomonadota bacterium]
MPKWKRMTDIAGASLGLMICAPVFMLIAGFIKTVSPGPVFFKQQRIGFGGKTFTFFKFRTMKVNADTTAHQKLLAELIKDDNSPGSAGKPMTKLDHDPQIIPCGNFLRKSCIDELPQLINVLIGDMSLIGPRPPIPYEVDEYDRWHRARLSTIPGMTGLWQISGKNRLTFKEMVRLDIRYLRNRSLWHDIKILLLTPRAIVSQIKEIL